MAVVATRADMLLMQLVGLTEIVHLGVIETIPGVAIKAVAGRHGQGTARLRSRAGGTLLSWNAPGSSSFGPDVSAPGDGDLLLEDGDDPDKWARVSVDVSELVPGPQEARVPLADVFNNAIGHTDITAAEASAGKVESYQIKLANVGPYTITNLVAWIDASVTGIEISDDNATWVAPTSEKTGLAFPALASGANDDLYLRRTIGPGAAADPDILNVIHMGFDAW